MLKFVVNVFDILICMLFPFPMAVKKIYNSISRNIKMSNELCAWIINKINTTKSSRCAHFWIRVKKQRISLTVAYVVVLCVKCWNTRGIKKHYRFSVFRIIAPLSKYLNRQQASIVCYLPSFNQFRCVFECVISHLHFLERRLYECLIQFFSSMSIQCIILKYISHN